MIKINNKVLLLIYVNCGNPEKSSVQNDSFPEGFE